MLQEFSGNLTARDIKTHVVHEIVLPSNAVQLRVRLAHPRGPGLGHMLCLSLFDSAGFRGSGHRDGTLNGSDIVHAVHVSPDAATPGYLPGPVSAGALRIFIHAHRIVPVDAFQYRLAIEWEEGPTAVAGRTGAVVCTTPPRAPGRPSWYRGDLHAHTVHSDGDWDIPALFSEARKAGLDFISLTDHNTTSQLTAVGQLPDPELLVIPGMELTTFRGHALSLGTSEWIDWGVLREDGG